MVPGHEGRKPLLDIRLLLPQEGRPKYASTNRRNTQRHDHYRHQGHRPSPMGAHGAAALLPDGRVCPAVHIQVRRTRRRDLAGRRPRRPLRAVLQLRPLLRARRCRRHARSAPPAVERHQPHQRSDHQPPSHPQQPHQDVHSRPAQRVLGHEPPHGVAPPRRRPHGLV